LGLRTLSQRPSAGDTNDDSVLALRNGSHLSRGILRRFVRTAKRKPPGLARRSTDCHRAPPRDPRLKVEAVNVLVKGRVSSPLGLLISSSAQTTASGVHTTIAMVCRTTVRLIAPKRARWPTIWRIVVHFGAVRASATTIISARGVRVLGICASLKEGSRHNDNCCSDNDLSHRLYNSHSLLVFCCCWWLLAKSSALRQSDNRRCTRDV
jgi:hypothetical protein